MNSYEIIVTPDAEADLYEIKNYIDETLLVPDVALNYIRVIRQEMMTDKRQLSIRGLLFICLRVRGVSSRDTNDKDS